MDGDSQRLKPRPAPGPYLLPEHALEKLRTGFENGDFRAQLGRSGRDFAANKPAPDDT